MFGSILLVVGVVIAVWRGSLALHWASEWQRWRTSDPSAAELYEINLWFESAAATLGATMAALGTWLVLHSRNRR